MKGDFFYIKERRIGNDLKNDDGFKRYGVGMERTEV